MIFLKSASRWPMEPSLPANGSMARNTPTSISAKAPSSLENGASMGRTWSAPSAIETELRTRSPWLKLAARLLSKLWRSEKAYSFPLFWNWLFCSPPSKQASCLVSQIAGTGRVRSTPHAAPSTRTSATVTQVSTPSTSTSVSDPSARFSSFSNIAPASKHCSEGAN
ncbi:hypothetical protein Cassandra_0412 [Pseudomonas phage Cassandra]|nr:hypothetical protein Cassandra_0412 [Pseudomonas phage Cassandra]